VNFTPQLGSWNGGSGRVLLLLCLVGVEVARGQSGAVPLQQLDLHVAFTRSTFMSINEADAKAAFKVFAKRVGERRGYNVTPRVDVFDDVDTLAANMDVWKPGLVIIDTWDYLSLALSTNIPIEFASLEQGSIHEPYYLLARSDGDVHSFSDIRGRHLLVLDNSNANNARHWMCTELLALGAADPASFVRQMEIKEKVTQVILPVFFGQADACIVDRSGFDIMKEMNPQVGRELAIMATSPPLLDTVCLVSMQGWKAASERQDLLDALAEINEDPAGQQILTLFRFDGMEPFKEEQLATVRSLRKRHDRLARQMAMDGEEGVEK